MCEGYATAFRAVCNELGIPCLIPSDFWSNHGWNLVQMEDGQWYHVDVTSDDPGRSTELVSGRESHTYFLRGDTFFFGDESLGFGENDETGYWPIASKTDYDPANKPTAPAQPELPAVPTIVSIGVNPEASGTAYAATQTVLVDGKKVEFQMYALKDAGGNPTNYVKLRDVADVLDGTAAQFNVTWSAEAGVGAASKTPYTSRNGQEGKTPYTGDRAYGKGPATTSVDGNALELNVFTLTDDNGGQSNYYKLRDLGQALGFNVGWSGDKGVFIETDKAYDPND